MRTKSGKPLTLLLSADIIKTLKGDYNLTAAADITELEMANRDLQYQADLRKLLVELSSSFINLPVSKLESAILDSLKSIALFVRADRAYIFEYDFSKMQAVNKIQWLRSEDQFKINHQQTLPIQPFSEWLDLLKKGESVIVKRVEEVKNEEIKSILLTEQVKSLLSIPLISEGSCTGFVGFDSTADYNVFTDFEHQLLQVYAQTLVNVRERIEKEQKLVEAKEKAEESDRLKSAFLANMSHEIRTPMNGIMGFLDLLREPDLSQANRENYIEIVNKSGKRLLETLNDIIEISKIEALEMKVHPAVVNTEEILNYFLDFFKPQAETKGISLVIGNHLKGDESVFITDKSKLE
jgi:K+-sensing histidine kinase KdpD